MPMCTRDSNPPPTLCQESVLLSGLHPIDALAWEQRATGTHHQKTPAEILAVATQSHVILEQRRYQGSLQIGTKSNASFDKGGNKAQRRDRNAGRHPGELIAELRPESKPPTSAVGAHPPQQGHLHHQEPS